MNIKNKQKTRRLPRPEQLAAFRLGSVAVEVVQKPYTQRDFDALQHRLAMIRDVANDLSLHSEDLQNICNTTERPVTRHLVSIEAKHEAITYLIQLRRLIFDLMHFAKIGRTVLRYTGEEDLADERKEILFSISRSLGYSKKLYTFCKADWKFLSRYLETPDIFAYSNWHWSQCRRYVWLLDHKLSQIGWRVNAVRSAYSGVMRAKLARIALSQELHDDLLVHIYQLRKVFEDLCRVLQVGRKRKTHYTIKCTPTVGDISLRENYRIFDNEYNEIRFSDLLRSRIRDQKKAKRIAKKIQKEREKRQCPR